MIYEKLKVWKLSETLAVKVYRSMSNCKDWGFRDQITRSALSVVSNIAEGMERKSKPDKVRFLVIAKSSLAEFKAQTQIGIKIKYIEIDSGKEWLNSAEEIGRMLQGLAKSLS